MGPDAAIDEDVDDATLEFAICEWIADPTKPAPTARQLVAHVYGGDGDYPDDEIATLALERDAALRALRATHDYSKDPTRKAAHESIEAIIEQRNKAEEQVRYLVRDLWQIAAALRCEPSQSGVMEAITALRAEHAEMRHRLDGLEK